MVSLLPHSEQIADLSFQLRFLADKAEEVPKTGDGPLRVVVFPSVVDMHFVSVGIVLGALWRYYDETRDEFPFAAVYIAAMDNKLLELKPNGDVSWSEMDERGLDGFIEELGDKGPVARHVV